MQVFLQYSKVPAVKYSRAKSALPWTSPFSGLLKAALNVDYLYWGEDGIVRLFAPPLAKITIVRVWLLSKIQFV